MRCRLRGLSLIFALLAAGCTSEPETSVRLTVRYEDAWQLDDLEVTAREQKRRTTPAEEVRVLVAPGWAGSPLPIVLRGYRGKEAWASGKTEVVPEAGKEVRGEVVLFRLPCGDWCTPPDASCELDGVKTCVVSEETGCPKWGAPVPCAGETPYCSLGVCGAACIDECATGERRCDGPGAVRLCGQADSDPCLDWLPPVRCAEGEVCSNGTCRPSCQDECQEGEVKCQGAGVSRCGDLDQDGCREWGPAEPCGAGQYCDQGACSATCTDECQAGAAECAGTALRACGQYDLDPCLDLSPGTSCVPQDACYEGQCAAGMCQSAPKLCATPPESTCIDGSTLRVYDAMGTCAEGQCSYASRDMACPNCPSCDACAGVTCTTPPQPAVCYQATGTCASGQCSYAYNNGAACDDGNACTESDTCASGVCSGTPKACNTPPAATCVNATTRRTFSGPGTCSGGSCSYASMDMNCAFGCQNGQCAACMGASCARETVSSGWYHTCGVKTDGTVACWGSNSDGRATPPAGTFSSVGAGGFHTCGVKTDGTVACWGSNSDGQATPPAGTFSSVSGGGYHTCGVKTDGTVACWGYNNAGQATPPAGTFSSVSAGWFHTCGVKTDGTVACWGNNGSGRATPPAGTFSSVSGGGYHTCGVKPDGTVACWGYNADGQATPPGGTFSSVSAGIDHTCGVKTDGTVACWGYNNDGQATAPAGTFSSVSAGEFHTCGVKPDGTVACWGNNGDGRATPPAGTFKQ